MTSTPSFVASSKAAKISVVLAPGSVSLNTFKITNCASGATPLIPSSLDVREPDAATVPATWVPWSSPPETLLSLSA